MRRYRGSSGGVCQREAAADSGRSTSGIGPDAAALNSSVDVDVVVIGAGQAGLSVAYFLNQAGLEPETGFVVLDANPEAGGAAQHRWPSLKFGTAHRIHRCRLAVR